MNGISLTTRRVFFLTGMLMSACVVHAQFFLGTRESSYLQAGYRHNSHWQVTGEFSVFSDLAKRQYARLILGYDTFSVSNLSLSFHTYYGTSFCQSFYNLGLLFHFSYSLPTKSHTTLYATFNPAYDSDLHYETYFTTGFIQHLFKALSFRSEYTTIPEYRMSERRIRFGLQFCLASKDLGKLQVSPLISIPIHHENYAVRLGVDSRYFF